MDNLLRLLDAGNLPGPQGLGQGTQVINLEQSLDLVDGIAVAGHANAETIPSERGIAVLVRGDGGVRVVAAIVGNVPVAAVKADAVGQDLESLGRGAAVGRSAAGVAVGSGKLVVARDGLVLFAMSVRRRSVRRRCSAYTLERILGKVLSLLVQVEDEVRDLNVGRRGLDVEDTVASASVDRDRNIFAGHGRSRADDGSRSCKSVDLHLEYGFRGVIELETAQAQGRRPCKFMSMARRCQTRGMTSEIEVL